MSFIATDIVDIVDVSATIHSLWDSHIRHQLYHPLYFCNCLPNAYVSDFCQDSSLLKPKALPLRVLRAPIPQKEPVVFWLPLKPGAIVLPAIFENREIRVNSEDRVNRVNRVYRVYIVLSLATLKSLMNSGSRGHQVIL